MIASVVPKLVAEHNAAYPNNTFDPTLVVTARTTGRSWTGTSSGPRLGRTGTGTEIISL